MSVSWEELAKFHWHGCGFLKDFDSDGISCSLRPVHFFLHFCHQGFMWLFLIPLEEL